MQTTIAALFALFLPLGLQAQVQVQVFAHTELRVVDQTIAPGTDISTGASLSWSNNHPSLPAGASMGLAVTGSTVRFQNYVHATVTVPPIIGSHAIRVRLTSPTAVRGTLRAEGSALLMSMFSVDVGNDGTLELTNIPAPVTAPYVLEQNLTIPPTGLDVVIFGSANAGWLNFVSSSTVTLSFAPTGANITRSGSACGADLAGRYLSLPVFWQLNRSFEFAVENAPVTPYAFFVVGITPQNIVIPPLGCVLRTDILVPLAAQIDPTGRSDLTLAVPEALTAFDARVQFVAATLDAQNNEIWRTSEVVQIRL